MSDTSKYKEVLAGFRDAIAAIQGALPLMRAVEIRIIPRFFEGTFDLLPVTLVTCDDPDQTEYATMEGHRYKTFAVYAAVLYATNQDYGETWLDDLLLWRERVENAIDPPDDDPTLPNVSVPIVKVDVLPQEVVESRLAGRGYGYSCFGARYTIVVERTRGTP